MQLKYSELNEGKLFLSNRRGIETKDVFESINSINDEWKLYDFFKQEIYIHEQDKHYKLSISKYMNDKYLGIDKSQNEEIDVIMSKLESVIETVEENIDDSEIWILERISKLREHIGLEHLRISEQNRYYQSNLEKDKKLDSRISEIDQKSSEVIRKLETHKQQIYEEIETKLNDMNNNVKDTNENLNTIKDDLKYTKEELDKSKKDIYKEILSIVGIFTAISFGAFGGISILNSLFGNVGSKGIKLSDIVILGCIASICILTLLYIFIIYLSRMTGLKISIDGSEEKFFRDNKVLIYSYGFLAIILLGASISNIINSNKETWDLFIDFINSWLKHQINNMIKIPS